MDLAIALCAGNAPPGVCAFPIYHRGHHFSFHGREFGRLPFFGFQVEIQVSEKVQPVFKDELTSDGSF